MNGLSVEAQRWIGIGCGVLAFLIVAAVSALEAWESQRRSCKVPNCPYCRGER